jgi:gliding motility-associated-like protein
MYQCYLKKILLLLLHLPFYLSLLMAQRGKDGLATISISNAILNRYTALATDANAGSTSITVANISDLNGNANFSGAYNPYASNTITNGDLIFIIQVQGATINSDNTAAFGNIINYNNTGRYELKEITQVVGNTIQFCPGLINSYNTSSNQRTMVVRVPRLSSLAVNNNASITALPWNGIAGGAIVLEVDGSATINGSVTADSMGFRGGRDVNEVVSFGATGYTYNDITLAAEKGESIAGNQSDYKNLFSGSYGRGAPANGGGGGNSPNNGGGGGSNVGINGVLNNWNGTGIKKNSPPNWANAWNLESPGFSTNISSGGGKGGYSYSIGNRDALVDGPDNWVWYGDYRRSTGGLGGRPLDYSSKKKLFMGGGGGAGEGNDNAHGDGNSGGGIVFFICYGNVSGSGIITANGATGFNTHRTSTDAAGGAGGGGSILVLSPSTIRNITAKADGGKGGDQLYFAPELDKQAEGPGGGGGGGYLGITTKSNITTSVKGGAGGNTASTTVTEFAANGATNGADGMIDNVDFATYETNTFSTLIDVAICQGETFVLPDNTITNTSIKKAYIFKTASGCDSIVYVNLKVLTVANTTLFPVICPGQSYTLPYTGQTVTTEGTYLDIGRKPGDLCDTRATIYLTVKDTSSEKVFTNICTGQTYTLPDKTVVSTQGVYTTKFTSSIGCDSTIVTDLRIVDSLKLSLIGFICEGKAFTLPNGKSITTAGNYPLYYKSAAGCDSIIEYILLNKKNATDTFEVTICKDRGYRLPNDSIVTTEGVYIVIVKDPNRCDSVLTVKVNISNNNETLVKMPTVFTPNSDGINDVLKVKGLSKSQLELFSVYDRWGVLLFNTTNLDNGWDGKLKGNNMPIGVYVYLVRAKDCDKQSRLYKGTVGIIR